jgi:hypothetical protein
VLPGVRSIGYLQLQAGYTWGFSVTAPRGGISFTNAYVGTGNGLNERVVVGDVERRSPGPTP